MPGKNKNPNEPDQRFLAWSAFGLPVDLRPTTKSSAADDKGEQVVSQNRYALRSRIRRHLRQ